VCGIPALTPFGGVLHLVARLPTCAVQADRESAAAYNDYNHYSWIGNDYIALVRRALGTGVAEGRRARARESASVLHPPRVEGPRGAVLAQAPQVLDPGHGRDDRHRHHQRRDRVLHVHAADDGPRASCRTCRTSRARPASTRRRARCRAPPPAAVQAQVPGTITACDATPTGYTVALVRADGRRVELSLTGDQIDTVAESLLLPEIPAP